MSEKKTKLPIVNVIFAIKDGEIEPQTASYVDPLETEHAIEIEEEHNPRFAYWAELYIPAQVVRQLRERVEGSLKAICGVEQCRKRRTEEELWALRGKQGALIWVIDNLNQLLAETEG